MRLVLQPAYSKLCGHACVAMVAGVGLERAIDVIGHEDGTETREIIEALNELGVRCAPRLRVMSRKRPIWPRRAILHINRPNYLSHWILAWDGTIYDPDGIWPDYGKWKIMSYLEIYG